MKDIPLQIALHSYSSRSRPLTSQRLVNMFAEKAPQEAKNGGMVLLNTPGLILTYTVGTGPIYGAHRMGSLIYVVSGNNAYNIDSAGTITNLGALGTVGGPVIMDDNGLDVIINLPSGASYLADATTLTQIVDADYQSSTSVCVLDGFAIFGRENSNIYQISGLKDAATYDALDFSSAEESPDNIVRVFANHGELWLFGEDTTEVHYNSGAGDFPFIPITGAAMDRGLAAKLAVAADDNTIFWLGDDRIVYRANGYTPTRVSTHGIERAIEEYGDISDAEAFIYTEEGHKFFVLTFPSAPATFVLDIATGLWHERESFGLGRWRASSFVRAFNKNLVGDYDGPYIYEIDAATYAENDEAVQRIMTMPPLTANKKRMFFEYLHLDVDVGVGLTTGQGSDPQIMMDWSDDGGNTFKNELWRSIGAIGKYLTRVVWRRLGTSRERTFRFTYTEKTKFNITGGYAATKVGAA